MAVLVEGISVVLLTDAIRAAYARDWTRFVAEVPNATLCVDGELARVGFMVPDAVRNYVQQLEKRGLRYLENGVARDMVVVDQQRGLMAPCDWIEFGHVNMEGDRHKRVAACQRKGSDNKQVVCPEGWTFEQSLSSTFGFIPTGKLDRSLEFLRRDNGLSVYRDRMTGKEVFIAEPGGETR
jgi:hypothetical protein